MEGECRFLDFDFFFFILISIEKIWKTLNYDPSTGIISKSKTKCPILGP